MLVAIAYRVSWKPGSAMSSLLMAVGCALLMAGAMVSTAILATMVTPVIVGCCVAAGGAIVAAAVAVAPVVGCVALVVVFAYVFKP